MKELENRIIKDGAILSNDILKVGSFLNQQIDSDLLKNMATETANYFKKEEVSKILTIEASGIAFATALAFEYHVPLVFAKKTLSSNVNGNLIETKVDSFTHGKTYNVTVPADYINKNDKILIADDFLAKGNALKGLIELCEKQGAKVVGCVVQIEKEYQNGGNELREAGYRVLSLAKIKTMSEGHIEFC